MHLVLYCHICTYAVHHLKATAQSVDLTIRTWNVGTSASRYKPFPWRYCVTSMFALDAAAQKVLQQECSSRRQHADVVARESRHVAELLQQARTVAARERGKSAQLEQRVRQLQAKTFAVS